MINKRPGSSQRLLDQKPKIIVSGPKVGSLDSLRVFHRPFDGLNEALFHCVR